jgi:hypothetical protein
VAKNTIFKRLAATAVVSGALFVGLAAPASASTLSKGYVQVCAQGNYRAYIEFPNRGNMISTVVYPGTCWVRYMGGNSWEPIEVFGKYNNGGSPFALGTVQYNGAVSGLGIGAEGTTSSGQHWMWTWW